MVSRKLNPIGALIVSSGCGCVLLALKATSSGNKILSALLPKNEPPISNLALLPKIIPAGLIRKRLALPLALIKPSILEILPPVTREKILSISTALLKKASPLVGTEKSEKL